MSRTIISRVIQQRKHADEGDIAQASRDGLDTFHLVGVSPQVFVFPLVDLAASLPTVGSSGPPPSAPGAGTPTIGSVVATEIVIQTLQTQSLLTTPSAGPTPVTPTGETPTIGVVIFTSVT